MDDDVDHDLIAFMRQALGWDKAPEETKLSADTGVRSSAQFIFDNALDVALDMQSCKNAAEYIWRNMKDRGYSTKSWQHELHPNSMDEDQVQFIFTMDLLSFCFWSESDRNGVYTVEHNGKKWTGYFSMVAALKRALLEGIPITSPYFLVDESICTDEVIRHVFRSSTDEPMPMLEERIKCLREASSILCERYDGLFINCIAEAEGSAGKLVNLLVKEFPCLRDETQFEGRTVKIYKRPQILVADIWASFDGESYGRFDDINSLTMFADYRIPQILQNFGCITYSPILELHIRDKKLIESRHRWETELRGCSIHCVELIRKEIIRNHPEAETNLNAILIDFFLYDLVKEREIKDKQLMPHHRTKSIWY